MISTLNAKYQTFYQKFVLGWISTSLIFIAIVSLCVWQFTRSQALHEFDISVHRLAFKLDELVESILSSLDSLPNYSNGGDYCQKNLALLERSVFDSPYVSGIVISAPNNQILCATKAYRDNLRIPPLFNTRSPVLLGPIQFKDNPNEFYLLQRRFNQYHIGTFLLKTIFDNLFASYNNQFNFIGLYDTANKKMIYAQGKLPELILPLQNTMLVELNQRGQSEAILPLNNLANIQLVIHRQPTEFISKLFKMLPLYLFPLIIFSWLFYRYLQRIINKRFSIEYALAEGLKKKQFYPVYQAVRDISTNKFCSAEVLMRWKTDFNEMIFPDHFIEEAENSGLIVPITLQLIETAFKECQTLLKKNKEFSLSFNLSPEHFKDEQFFNRFYQLCTDYKIPARQLGFELTERGLFDKSDTASINRMLELRKKGYSLAIDDFGTGQANITYLQHFPFNYLKIDKIFVKTIGTGAIIESLNQGIIKIAHSLDLKVIAEGVETPEQLAYLKANGVTLIQGWVYAKAMPYALFCKLI